MQGTSSETYVTYFFALATGENDSDFQEGFSGVRRVGFAAAGAGLSAVTPHPQNVDGASLGIDLINEAMLNIDPPRIATG